MEITNEKEVLKKIINIINLLHPVQTPRIDLDMPSFKRPSTDIIIDLIEEGDYVNGELIKDKYDTRISSIRSNFSEKDIKIILTKESYMTNCYQVGGENGI